MAKTYQCKLCGQIIREIAVPKIIVKEGLCVDCYQTKYRALNDALNTLA